MRASKYEDVHQLVDRFSGEMSIKDVCEQENVSYRGYLAWRRSHGFSRRHKASAPDGLIEVEVTDLPPCSAKALNVHIEFENGLRIDRPEMEVDSLIKFLTQIKPVLCLN